MYSYFRTDPGSDGSGRAVSSSAGRDPAAHSVSAGDRLMPCLAPSRRVIASMRLRSSSWSRALNSRALSEVTSAFPQ